MLADENPPQTDISENIEFLFNSYTNTLQIIQFFDTKAGAYVAVSGVLASLIASSIVQVLSNLLNKETVVSKYILAFLVSVLALLFLYHVVQVIYQAFLVLSPRSGLDLDDDKGKATGLFWAGNVVEYLNQQNLDQYTTAILKMEPTDIATELSYETAKLAKITNIKFGHLRKATSHCKWAILFWAFLLLCTSVLDVLSPYLL